MRTKLDIYNYIVSSSHTKQLNTITDPKTFFHSKEQNIVNYLHCIKQRYVSNNKSFTPVAHSNVCLYVCMCMKHSFILQTKSRSSQNVLCVMISVLDGGHLLN